MIFTGQGGKAFLLWFAVVTGGYYLMAAFVDPWVAMAAACVVAAAVTFALGRSLNHAANEHTFGFVPVQWIGLAAPAFFGVTFGLAELIRSQ